jgi:hypothetical protein
MLDRTQSVGGDTQAFWLSASEISVTLTRFGRKRRRVLLLAWLTLLPVWTALPVSSQARDIFATFSYLLDKPFAAPYGARIRRQPLGKLRFHSEIFEASSLRPILRPSILSPEFSGQKAAASGFAGNEISFGVHGKHNDRDRAFGGRNAGACRRSIRDRGRQTTAANMP